MAYIGREPQIGNYQVCDAISVVNGQAAYTMQVSSVNVIPESVNHMIVSLNGVIQKPGSSYTISSSTITFSSNLATGDSIDFIYLLGNVLDLGTPSDSTVTTAKLSGNLVTPGTLDVNGQELILDADADTSITADTDDQIDIKVAGADDFQITANTLTALSGSTIKADTIAETTSANGVAVDGLTIKDGKLNTNDSVVTANITDANVTTAKVADDAITAAKLNNDIISGTTALASEPADTDEFLVSDAGTLKRIDYSLIKATSPGLNKISTSTVNSAHDYINFDNVFSSSYDNYLVVGRINNTYGATNIGVRFRASGSTETGNNYNRYGTRLTSSSYNNATSQSYMAMYNNDDVNDDIAFYFYVHTPFDSSHSGHIMGSMTSRAGIGMYFAGNVRNTTSYDGISIFNVNTGAGDLNNSKTTIYGLAQ